MVTYKLLLCRYRTRGLFLKPRPKETASDYIARHIDADRIFVGCEGEEPDIAHAIGRLGNKAFVFSGDFSHEVNITVCKHEIEEMRQNPGLSAADKQAILLDNAKRLYNL